MTKDIETITNEFARTARKLTIARRALEKIAAFDDKSAGEYLERTGKYSYFDEPSSVRTARKALRNITEVDQEKGKGG